MKRFGCGIVVPRYGITGGTTRGGLAITGGKALKQCSFDVIGGGGAQRSGGGAKAKFASSILRNNSQPGVIGVFAGGGW